MYSVVHYACASCGAENTSTRERPECGGCGAVHVREASGIRVLDMAARGARSAEINTTTAQAVAEVQMADSPVVSKRNFITKGLYGVGGVLLVGVGTALTGITVKVPQDMSPIVANGVILAAGFIGGGLAGIIKRAGESLLGKR